MSSCSSIISVGCQQRGRDFEPASQRPSIVVGRRFKGHRGNDFSQYFVLVTNEDRDSNKALTWISSGGRFSQNVPSSKHTT